MQQDKPQPDSLDLAKLGDKPFIMVISGVAEARSPAHVHPGFELSLILSRKGTFFLQGREFSFAKGDLLLLDSMQAHAVWGRGVKILTVLFRADLVFSFATAKETLHMLRPFLSGELVRRNEWKGQSYRETLRLAYRDCNSDSPLRRISAWQRVVGLLLSLAAHFGADAADTGESVEESFSVSKAMRFLQNNFREPVSLGEMAAEAGLSISRFCHVFKDLMHISPLQYRNQLRIRSAMELLTTTRQKPSTVALSVGFKNLPTFYRVFRRVAGGTPGAFQKAQKSI